MTITKISQQKLRKDWVNIFLDEEFWISLSKDSLLEHQLYKGKVLNATEKYTLEKLSNESKLLERVINYIYIRPRSQKEVREYLKHRVGVDEEYVEKLIETCKQKDFINDTRFADWFVKQRMEFKVQGKNKIRAELIKKGISSNIIDSVLRNLSDETKDKAKVKLKEEVGKELKKRGVGSLVELEFKERQKVIQKFMRRGYGYEEIVKQLKD